MINGLNTYVPSFQSGEKGDGKAIVITGSKQGTCCIVLVLNRQDVNGAKGSPIHLATPRTTRAKQLSKHLPSI